MKALAGSVLFSMVAAGAASFLPAHAPQAERIVPNLRMESSTVDPQTTPKVLERRFGRDTLLYFPSDRAGDAVALQLARQLLKGH